MAQMLCCQYVRVKQWNEQLKRLFKKKWSRRLTNSTLINPRAGRSDEEEDVIGH
jgi:hypothetical protein